jgi:hypothetical protein
VLPFWEVGAYVQFAVREDDRAFDWAGVKLRSKFVTPEGWDPHFRLGVNLEVSYVPPTYESDRWGLEVRPIAAWHDDRWLVAFNPILGQSLAGPGAPRGPTFEPALKVDRSVGPVAVGLEYYGAIGPLASPLPAREQAHYLFEVVDLISGGPFELNAGIGEGLTASSAGITVKVILGYELELTGTMMARRGTNDRDW